MRLSVGKPLVVMLLGVLGVAAIALAISTGKDPSSEHLVDVAEVPTPDVAAGGVIYRAQCASCHQSAAVGGALSYSENAPSLQGAHPIEIATAVRGGPGNMPVFGPDALSDAELEQLVTYVLFLQDPGSPGGAPISAVGPVSEGAVTWLVGVLALVVALRWIGKRDG